MCPAAAVLGGDVDLLDLVVDDHHEPRHRLPDGGDGRVGHPLGGAGVERLPGADGEQCVGHVAQMPAAPGE
ncbi:hypothetical protein [Pseudonocardia sp. GCM10023141]|uniref:hypothetical protein n=1 Tax=Pseudonocardia sp. GCM10023141 TaxID=3252653 RepID=UPI003622DB5E